MWTLHQDVVNAVGIGYKLALGILYIRFKVYPYMGIIIFKIIIFPQVFMRYVVIFITP